MKIFNYVIKKMPVHEIDVPWGWVVATKHRFLFWDFIVWELED